MSIPFYHDGYELNPLCDKISKILKSFCRMIIIQLVLEEEGTGVLLNVFPLILDNFSLFYDILKKIFILDLWQFSNMSEIRNAHVKNLIKCTFSHYLSFLWGVFFLWVVRTLFKMRCVLLILVHLLDTHKKLYHF